MTGYLNNEYILNDYLILNFYVVIKYNEMVMTVYGMIRDAISKTKTLTSMDMKLRTDGHIIIRESDWEELATPVANRILNPTAEEKKKLPVYDHIHFFIKKLGK